MYGGADADSGRERLLQGGHLGAGFGGGYRDVSFIDPLHGTFAGLGHSISDADTGAELTLLSGEIVPVTVTGCVRGAAGSPGELRGEFAASPVGRVLANDTAGVYGSYSGPAAGQIVEVANLQEVTTGPAELWATVEGTAAKAYAVRIERVTMTGTDPNRNLLIRVTDQTLLEKDGRYRTGNERLTDCAERPPCRSADPCAGKRPCEGVCDLCCYDAGKGRRCRLTSPPGKAEKGLTAATCGRKRAKSVKLSRIV